MIFFNDLTFKTLIWKYLCSNATDIAKISFINSITSSSETDYKYFIIDNFYSAHSAKNYIRRYLLPPTIFSSIIYIHVYLILPFIHKNVCSLLCIIKGVITIKILIKFTDDWKLVVCVFWNIKNRRAKGGSIESSGWGERY